MAAKLIPVMEIDVMRDDQYDGEYATTLRVENKSGKVYLPAGTYDIIDLIDGLRLLLDTGPKAPLGRGKPEPYVE